MIHRNVSTAFSPREYMPAVDPTAFVHPLAAVIGHVVIGRRVMVCPAAVVRGDEGMPLHVGEDSNIQDGAVLHGLVTERDGRKVEQNIIEVEGTEYAVYVGKRVSLAHQSQIHGPAFVGDDSFIGMQNLVFKSRIGHHCVIEPKCLLMGVTIPDGRFVPAGSVVKDQKAAETLPVIDEDYPLKNLNSNVVRVNIELAEGYRNAGIIFPRVLYK